ncbi:YIP1 family protein [Tumebacillus sp. ITR2]|uniref:YIP1 family protein n=1 Tax=Tumebacillus amylolyticus TaxID=2801339 RepID=A0ABS1JAY3_9BACL|nr:Yip1 family protein [Tumebacillus amylolyticus]MBL0387436.1 YIP1 family protein [Tumebacillus amylolyticus]
MNMSPWITMWTQPRATMRELLDGPRQAGMVALLAIFAGIHDAYNNASTRNMGENLNGWTWLPILIGGAIGGYFMLYFAGWLLTMVGRWNGGHGTQEDVRRAWAWSTIPAVWTIPLMFVEIALYGDSMFTKNPQLIYDNLFTLILTILITIVQLVVAIWGIVVWLKCLGEAHRFSAGKALATTIYSGLLIAGVVLVFVLLIALVF